jgi:hypothetical protein
MSLALNKLRKTELWAAAQAMPDPHFPSEAGVRLSDHLLAVHAAARALLLGPPRNSFTVRLRASLEGRVDTLFLWDVLGTAALFHDLAKPQEVDRDHPKLGQEAVEAVLPSDWPEKALIGRLVRYHDLPWGWWQQKVKTSTVPSQRAWRRLGRKMLENNPFVGVLLVALHSMADVHGHSTAADTVWFVAEANRHILGEAGLVLPVPKEGDLLGS